MWIVINTMTNEIVERNLEDEVAALKYIVSHKGDPLTHQYRAGRKKKVKK